MFPRIKLQPGVARGILRCRKQEGMTDAVEILQCRFYEGDTASLESLEQTRANEEIARKIRALRTKAGLTQAHSPKLLALRLRLSAGLRTPTMKGTLFRCFAESPLR